MIAAESYDRLPDAVAEIFGEDATAEQSYELLTVDVPPASWIAALETARDRLGCTYFDWLSAVDEPGTGFRVCAHLVALPDRAGPGPAVRRLLVRTTVPHEAAVLPSAIGVYAGAAWHERETHEMFGIGFDGHPHLVPLLLPEGFEGHPLRKDFVLAARVAKAWPGAKEPGESEHGGPKRRTMLPPGVPDPNEWGPLKGQLPPAPARPARAARPAGDRPARRTRSASDGSAGQRPAVAPDTAPSPAPGTAPRATRASGPAPGTDATAPNTDAPAPAPAPATDAPWHNARPAFDDAADRDAGAPADADAAADAADSAPPQPLRRLRSGGPGAEPPVREGAGRGEPPRSGTPTEQPPNAADAANTTDTADAADTPKTPDTPEAPDTPNTPAGGDTE
ncbi:NADH:ubiquinone oxidoreductase subunit C [Streptomyces sp. 840.1]|uniref:NADH-quinone oxidoreductase subunit C n=1 Tax=Streptomyces sp. 840.1 TaxID=2485152 RepID=UPI000F487CF3|nr:NADH-quinone oxidoreductase subunit C [Streptomyces sp. 840.1]ROQ66843.1 NADH:ubiquinone oxidoreductase subunit C [Streptomyces sp. 840.1]